MPTNRSSPRLRIIISSDIDISETSNSAKLSCRQNISAGPSTVLVKSMPSALARPSMIGQVRGLLVMARLSCKLAIVSPLDGQRSCGVELHAGHAHVEAPWQALSILVWH